MVECESCWKHFKSVKVMERHKQTTQYCKKYKSISFVCRACGYMTRGVKNLHEHMETCNINTEISDNPYNILEKRIIELEQENAEFRKGIKKIECEDRLLALIEFEKFKNKMYRHIIEKNTNIKLDDLILDTSDGIHIYNTKDINISVFVHDCLKTMNIFSEEREVKEIKYTEPEIVKPECTEIVPSEKHKVKGNMYRVAKAHMQLLQEPSIEEKEKHVKLVDEKINGQLKKMGDEPDMIHMNKIFEGLLSNLRKNKNQTKILDELRVQRWSIFGNISVELYTNLLQNHISIIEDIYKEKSTDKRILSEISKSLTPFESRLLTYGQYTTTTIEIDDIQKFQKILELRSCNARDYVVYDEKIFCDKLCNYGLSLFSIQENIRRVMSNCFGYNNIIYVPFPKNTQNDPYSFYTLEKIENGKRLWRMDGRLEYLCKQITDSVLPYIISTFRKIYFDVFGDNDFREKYKTNCQVTELDCEQLLENALIFGEPRKLCDMLRNMVRNISTFHPTENDRFNLYGDCIVQRTQFQKEKDENNEIDIIKDLFDGITQEEAVKLCNTKAEQFKEWKLLINAE